MSDKSLVIHEIFLGRLRESHRAVWFVAQVLWKTGMAVKMYPVTEAPRFEEWQQHSDDGDLYVRENQDPWKRLEVKRLRIEFTCKDDWPFEGNFMVDQKSTFDSKETVPWVYMILSQDMTHYGRVDVARTRATWIVNPRRDKETGLTRDYYFCRLPDVRFNSFEDLINEKET